MDCDDRFQLDDFARVNSSTCMHAMHCDKPSNMHLNMHVDDFTRVKSSATA